MDDALAPPGGEVVEERVEPLLQHLARPRTTSEVRLDQPGMEVRKRPEHNERRDAVGMDRGVVERHGAALGNGVQEDLLRAHGIENGADVLGALFQARHGRKPRRGSRRPVRRRRDLPGRSRCRGRTGHLDDVDGHCLGFTATAGDTGGYGISSATDGDWHAAGEEACSISNRLYCFRFACPAVPVPSCADFDKGSLIVSETKVGKENLRLKLARGPALAQSDLGSPLAPDGTAYTVCLYEDGEVLRGTLDVNRAGDTCGSKPCWKAIGGFPDGKGWKYKDKHRIEDGIKIATLKGSAAGRPTIQLEGGNNVSKGQDDQPLGIARHLSGSTSVVAQFHGHDLAPCFSVTLDTVQKSLGTFFQAKR